MNVYEALKAVEAERAKDRSPRRVWISRRAWSMSGAELARAACLHVTSGPDGCVYLGKYSDPRPNYPLNGADLLAEDWYLTFPPASDKR